MKRSVTNLLMVACAMASLLCGAAWWFSYGGRIGLFGLPGNTTMWVDRGVVCWRHTYRVGETGIPEDEWYALPLPPRRVNPVRPDWPVFRYSSGHEMGIMSHMGGIRPAQYSLLLTPLWSYLLVFAPWPIWYLIRMPIRQRRRRIANGLCGRCAYDLRGCATNTCPECGTDVPVRAVVQA